MRKQLIVIALLATFLTLLIMPPPEPEAKPKLFLPSPILRVTLAQTVPGLQELNLSNVVIISMYRHGVVLNISAVASSLSNWADLNELIVTTSGVLCNKTLRIMDFRDTGISHVLSFKFGFYVDAVNGETYTWVWRTYNDDRDLLAILRTYKLDETILHANAVLSTAYALSLIHTELNADLGTTLNTNVTELTILSSHYIPSRSQFSSVEIYYASISPVCSYCSGATYWENYYVNADPTIYRHLDLIYISASKRNAIQASVSAYVTVNGTNYYDLGTMQLVPGTVYRVSTYGYEKEYYPARAVAIALSQVILLAFK